MAKNSKTASPAPAVKTRLNATQIARIVLGSLLAINIGAAYMVWNPPGGSAEALEQDLPRLQAQLAKARATLTDAEKRSGALDKGRGSSDEFLKAYFVTERMLPATLLDELSQIAKRAGIKDKGTAFTQELIEGSEALGMVTISVNFEGTYTNLLNFVRELDRSNSLLIPETLTAIPLQDSKTLSVTMKINGFIREMGSGMPVEQAASVEPGATEATATEYKTPEAAPPAVDPPASNAPATNAPASGAPVNAAPANKTPARKAPAAKGSGAPPANSPGSAKGGAE